MQKVITIDIREIEKYIETIDSQRKELEKLRVSEHNLKKEIEFLKDSGENILVIVKSENKPDKHEYITYEKNVISELVEENSKIRQVYDDLNKKNEILENQKSIILLKYQEMYNYYQSTLGKLENDIKTLEGRSLIDRLINKKETINIDRYKIEQPKTLTLDISTEEKPEIKDTKRPRGWNLMPEFIDENGNIYKKGILQKNN